MSLRRHAAAALALTAVLSVVACTEADNGNNTLAEDEHPGAQTTSSASATPQGGPATVAPPVGFPAGKPVPLEAKDNEFAPAAFSVPAGDVEIVMENTGASPHTFTQADLKVDVNADAGKKATIKLKDLKPGTYHFVCKYHESLKMVGDLTVT